MFLSEAHPGGYLGFTRQQEDTETSLEAFLADLRRYMHDPEEGLAWAHWLHNSRSISARLEISKEVRQNADNIVRKLFKAWGVLTPAQRLALVRERTPSEIAFLQLVGVWDKIQEDLTYEQIEAIRPILEQARAFREDPDSSEGITIYPTVASWAQNQSHPDPQPPKRQKGRSR